MNRPTTGSELRALRLRKGLTQAEVEKLADIGKRTMGHMELRPVFQNYGLALRTVIDKLESLPDRPFVDRRTLPHSRGRAAQAGRAHSGNSFFLQNLRTLRKNAGLSLVDLGRAIGKTRQYVHLVESRGMSMTKEDEEKLMLLVSMTPPPRQDPPKPPRCPQVDKRALGAAIREARIVLDIPQTILAERLETNWSIVSHYEIGKTRRTWKTLRRIASALETSAERLVERAREIEQAGGPEGPPQRASIHRGNLAWHRQAKRLYGPNYQEYLRRKNRLSATRRRAKEKS